MAKKAAETPTRAPSRTARAGRATPAPETPARKASARKGGNDAKLTGPIQVDPDQVSVQPVPLADIIRDPRLQARAAGVNKEVVDDYAGSMKDGASFPPVALIRIEEDGLPHGLYLVDGWHRDAAATKAGKEAILAHILPGTWRDAVIAAAKANGGHGLRRSHEDKRRSVRLVLGDPELCKLSGRNLGRVIDVSHTYVDEVRKHYGLAPGEQLTEDIRRRMDGEPSPEWMALAAGQEKWVQSAVERIRKTATVDELAKIKVGSGVGEAAERAAVALRLTELQVNGWPWPEDEDATEEERLAHRIHLVETADTADDARRMATSRGCPNAESLLRLLADDVLLGSDYGYMELDRMAKEHANRPAVVQKIERARTARAEAVRADPHLSASAIHRLKDDPAAQLAAFHEASPETVAQLRPNGLCVEVRDGPYRAMMEKTPGLVGACADPVCLGWTLPRYENGPHACVRCEKDPRHVAEWIRSALRGVGLLLVLPDYGVVVRSRDLVDVPQDVVVDAVTVDLLVCLQAALEKPTWLAKLPPALRENLRAWQTRSRPRVTGVDPEATEPEAAGPTDQDGSGETTEVDDPPGNAAEDLAAAVDESGLSQALGEAVVEATDADVGPEPTTDDYDDQEAFDRAHAEWLLARAAKVAARRGALTVHSQEGA